MAHEHHHADGKATPSPSPSPPTRGRGDVAARYTRAFAIGVTLNTVFVLVEFTFGLMSNSLALVADAGHNLSDVLALVLAWGAAALAQRQATLRRTYGWGRSTILAGLVNALSLLVVTGAVAWEAIRRLADPAPVAGGVMIWVALVGVVVNATTAALFLPGRERDVNIRGAFLHMSSDAAVSVGVIVAGVVILATGWLWVDPALGLVIGVVIVANAWLLLREALDLALDAVPEGVDLAAVQQYLSSVPSVQGVHDLHVWGMSTTQTALSAHLVMPGALADDELLARAAHELHERFGIQHATLQVEGGDPSYPCPLAAIHVL